MMTMLRPDLLDRRALALVQLLDALGRPLAATARMTAPALRLYAKGSGRYAVLGAAGLEDYAASFATPAAPALRSVSLPVDIVPGDGAHLPRRFTLALPRDPDPAQRGTAASLFDAIPVALLPSPAAGIPATAAAVRVTVRKRNDGRRVAGALVRVASDNGRFTATGMTDATGEALVLIPAFPGAFPGPGAKLQDFLPGKVTAVADPARAVLVAEDGLLAAQAEAARQVAGFADPDALAAAFPAPSAGAVAIRLSTRRPAIAQAEWRAP